MRCQRAQTKLMAYHDSELSAGAARRLEKHLESCEECRRLLEKLRLADYHASQSEGINPVVGVPDMPPPHDRYWESFTARVLDRVEEDAATRAPERKKTGRSWDLFMPWMVPAFSVALVVVVAAGVLFKIGDPVAVIKVPSLSTESARDEDVLVKKALPAKTERLETENKTATRTEESGRAPVEKHDQPDETIRRSPSAGATPLPSLEPREAPEPESSSTEMPAKIAKAIAAEEKPAPRVVKTAAKSTTDKGAVDVKKKEALAEPVTEVKAREVELASDVVPMADTALTDAQRGAVSPRVVTGTDAAISSKAADKTAARPSPDVLSDSTPVASESVKPDQHGREASIAAEMNGSFDQAAEKEDHEQDTAAVVSAPVPSAPSDNPVIEGYTAGMDAENEMKVTDAVMPSLAGSSETPAPYEAGPPLMEPESIAERPMTDEIPDLSGESESVVSGAEALDSAGSVKENRPSFGSGLPYRGPEDQLNHAKRLAEVRKFWESEQVLKDLISQEPPIPIQEEASILLVRVLNNQNRVNEAQHTLDEAKIQFPSNDMIQTFELSTDGKIPAQ